MKTNILFLFHATAPLGLMFKLTDKELKEKLNEGWLDSPANLTLPDNNDTGLLIEDAKNAKPDDIIKLVESYGFIVLTKEQLKAEANKMADIAFDVENLTDEMIISEAERRGLKESKATNDTSLLDEFNLDPMVLSINELVELGNDKFKLSLRTNMKKETLINKITEHLIKEV